MTPKPVVVVQPAVLKRSPVQVSNPADGVVVRRNVVINVGAGQPPVKGTINPAPAGAGAGAADAPARRRALRRARRRRLRLRQSRPRDRRRGPVAAARLVARHPHALGDARPASGSRSRSRPAAGSAGAPRRPWRRRRQDPDALGSARRRRGSEAFSGELVSDKSLDEVILEYLADDGERRRALIVRRASVDPRDHAGVAVDEDPIAVPEAATAPAAPTTAGMPRSRACAATWSSGAARLDDQRRRRDERQLGRQDRARDDHLRLGVGDAASSAVQRDSGWSRAGRGRCRRRRRPDRPRTIPSVSSGEAGAGQRRGRGAGGGVGAARFVDQARGLLARQRRLPRAPAGGPDRAAARRRPRRGRARRARPGARPRAAARAARRPARGRRARRRPRRRRRRRARRRASVSHASRSAAGSVARIDRRRRARRRAGGSSPARRARAAVDRGGPGLRARSARRRPSRATRRRSARGRRRARRPGRPASVRARKRARQLGPRASPPRGHRPASAGSGAAASRPWRRRNSASASRAVARRRLDDAEQRLVDGDEGGERLLQRFEAAASGARRPGRPSRPAPATRERRGRLCRGGVARARVRVEEVAADDLLPEAGVAGAVDQRDEAGLRGRERKRVVGRVPAPAEELAAASVAARAGRR